LILFEPVSMTLTHRSSHYLIVLEKSVIVLYPRKAIQTLLS